MKDTPERKNPETERVLDQSQSQMITGGLGTSWNLERWGPSSWTNILALVIQNQIVNNKKLQTGH